MAIYNLFAGGKNSNTMRAKLGAGCGCPSGDCADYDADTNLPYVAQPDNRVDGAYGYRDKVDFKTLLNRLNLRYGKKPEDLKVGDKLRIFLNPNHSRVTSVQVDVREHVAGLGFKVQPAVELSGAQNEEKVFVYKSTYDEICHGIRAAQAAPEEAKLADAIQIDETDLQRTTAVYANTVGGFYTDKVNAIEIEITSIPTDGLQEHGEYLFSRVFEVYGYSV